MISLKQFIWWMLCPKYSVGVFVVALNGDEVLLIKKKRGISTGWQIPGGGKKKKFTLDEAAKSEFFEETGKKAFNLRHVITTFKKESWDIRIVYWTDQTDGKIEVQDTFEISEARFFKIREAMEVLDGDFRLMLYSAVQERHRYKCAMT